MILPLHSLFCHGIPLSLHWRMQIVLEPGETHMLLDLGIISAS